MTTTQVHPKIPQTYHFWGWAAPETANELYIEVHEAKGIDNWIFAKLEAYQEALQLTGTPMANFFGFTEGLTEHQLASKALEKVALVHTAMIRVEIESLLRQGLSGHQGIICYNLLHGEEMNKCSQ